MRLKWRGCKGKSIVDFTMDNLRLGGYYLLGCTIVAAQMKYGLRRA